MKKRLVLGSLLTIAAFSLQPAPLAAAAESPFVGVSQGSLDLSPSGLSQLYEHRSKCVERRAAAMTIRNGYVYIEYANWKGHKMHYRGSVDAAGAVTTYHTNSDGTKAQLTGQISNNALSGNMMREGCAYTVKLNRT